MLRAWGVGFGVKGVGSGGGCGKGFRLGAWDLGFGVEGVGCGLQDLFLRNQGFGFLPHSGLRRHF